MTKFSLTLAARNVFILLLAVVTTLFLASQNSKLQAKISVLNGKNQALEEQNNVLKTDRQVLLDSIRNFELQIGGLMQLEHDLYIKNGELEKKIKNLKSKYETANNHTANYNADSIRRYFSEFN